VITLLEVAIVIAIIVGLWKMFIKADQPGWACLIPFYNLWVLNRIGGKEWYWFIGYFIPLLNFVLYLLLAIAIARKFGYPVIFGVGIFILPFLFYPIIGFSHARYNAAA